MKYYNTELNKNEAYKLRTFLIQNGIKFETSSCYNLVHFQILLDEKMFDDVEDFIFKMND